MNIPVILQKPAKDAPKDRPLLLYSPEYVYCRGIMPETVELVRWVEELQGFVATGLAWLWENSDELENDQRDLIEQELWPIASPRPWFWCDCSEIVP